MTEAADDIMTMKVTTKNPIRFYIRSALSFFKSVPPKEGEEPKATVEELVVSALGNAINVAVACASRCEASGVAEIANVKTAYVKVDSSGSYSKSVPQVTIHLKRLPGADTADVA